jgi:hypothetical protein
MHGERLTPARIAVVALAALVAALVLGVAARLAAGAGLIAFAGPVAEPAGQLGRWVIALGAPWLAVAWALGALARRPALGAVAGAVALTGGTGAWYVLSVSTGASLHYALPVAVGWSAASVASGLAFGAAGALWRTGATVRTRALGLAVLAGCLIGEVALLVTVWNGRAARAVLAVELAVGVASPFVLARRRGRELPLALAMTVVVALLAAGAESAVRDALANVGWRGR